jgi:class 3 adenylate cyclase
MAKLQRRHVDNPTEVTEVPAGTLASFSLGDLVAARATFRPGWRWRDSVKPYAGTEWCEFHHTGLTLSGRARIVTRDGAEMEVGPMEFYEVPPGHDAWVLGDEPWISIEWSPGAAYGRAASGSGSRMVRTLLFTDIVESTAAVRALGDPLWRDLLARHNGAVRAVIERFGGREVATTGDGFLIIFDGAERAVLAGKAMVSAVDAGGLRIRVGIHTGEVELTGDDVAGLAVHVAARVMGEAGPGEVLVSWTTRDLLAGSSVVLEDLGVVSLKGVPEPRPVHRVIQGS